MTAGPFTITKSTQSMAGSSKIRGTPHPLQQKSISDNPLKKSIKNLGIEEILKPGLTGSGRIREWERFKDNGATIGFIMEGGEIKEELFSRDRIRGIKDKEECNKIKEEGISSSSSSSSSRH